MSDEGVDKQGNDGGANQIAEIIHTFGNSSGNECCSGAAEHHLEKKNGNELWVGLLPKEEVAAAKPATNAITKHNREPCYPEKRTRNDEVADVLGGNIDAVFASHQAAFEA